MQHKCYVKEVCLAFLTIGLLDLVYTAPFPKAYVQSFSSQHLREPLLQRSRYHDVNLVSILHGKIETFSPMQMRLYNNVGL